MKVDGKTLLQSLNPKDAGVAGICSYGMVMRSPQGVIYFKLHVNDVCHARMCKYTMYDTTYKEYEVLQVSYNVARHIKYGKSKGAKKFLNYLVSRSPMKHYIKKATASSAMRHGITLKDLDKHTFTHAALVGVMLRDVSEHPWKMDTWNMLVDEGCNEHAAYLMAQFRLYDYEVQKDAYLVQPPTASHTWLDSTKTDMGSYIAFHNGVKYKHSNPKLDLPILDRCADHYKGVSCAVFEIPSQDGVYKGDKLIDKFVFEGVNAKLKVGGYALTYWCTKKDFVAFAKEIGKMFE